MARWYGKIGFVGTRETSPGVYLPEATEREYFGDLIRAKRTAQTAEKMTDDLALSNQISILADPYVLSNLGWIRYATFGGSKWRVTSAEAVYPRVILEIGSLYNGEEPEENEDG